MKTLLTAIILIFAIVKASAQNTIAKFSNDLTLAPGEQGYYNRILGESDEYLYVFYGTYRKKGILLQRIASHDKKTMEEVNSVRLVDKNDAARKAELGNKVCFSVEFNNDKFYLLFKESFENEIKIFVEVYDTKFDKEISLMELMSIPKESKFDITVPKITFKKESILVSQMSVNNVDFIYALFDKQFSKIADGRVKLVQPEEESKMEEYSIKGYELDEYNNVYFKQSATLLNDQRRCVGYITIFNLTSKSMETIDINPENKSIFSLSLIDSNDGMKAYGFFCDYNKTEKDNRTYGIFYLPLNQGIDSYGKLKYSNFKPELLLNAYNISETDERYNVETFNSISRRINIEKIITDEKGNSVLFCSEMVNYVDHDCTTTSSGGLSCKDVITCMKENVTVFKLTAKGDIVWISNIDRKYKFYEWDFLDLRVVERDDDYFVYYSSYRTDISLKAASEEHKGLNKDVYTSTDQLHFGIFNKMTGEVQTTNVVLNKQNVPMEERKFCAIKNIQSVNNQFYVASVRTKLAPWTYATCLVPPVFAYLLLSEKTFVQITSIGKIYNVY